ncbi:GntR family transcriptional regulator [Ectobacillus sp. JY-23]|uniref:GntR family transcriptional regulator n=1 Tax=Ectobacillus sp. JY-23 TaxID=2933872 RepID=UPI001FF4FE9A|nr:GntR family transcriptional regulator [Ectobacillus sp. JY-23]UOY91008.1 GntR family transcriptional regulator [Ectobacillus sp. JY-23]
MIHLKDIEEGKALHSKVKDAIIHLIKKGEYAPHTQLPTEAEFCDTFNVSRTTVRTALQQLTVEGYVYRVQGRGTFVSENKIKQTLTATSGDFNQQVSLQGRSPSIHVLSLEVIPADSVLEKHLYIKEGDPVNKLERVRYADGTPLQYEIAYLPWHKTPGLNQAECEKSLYKLLDTQFGLKIKRTVEHMELFMADEDIAEKLDIPVDAPCFYIETFAYLEDESIIEYSKTFFRGDKANFVIERTY